MPTRNTTSATNSDATRFLWIVLRSPCRFLTLKQHWYLQGIISSNWQRIQTIHPMHINSLVYSCKHLQTEISLFTDTHTHTNVLWPSWILSGTTQVSWHQKGKTRKVKPIWIYWSKRCHQLGHMQICTLTQTQPRQHPITHSLIHFCHSLTTAVKHTRYSVA